MSDLQDLIARNAVMAYNQGFERGVASERERLTELLIANKVLRVDALGSLVFVNCDTLEVEYLPSLLTEGKED